MSARSLLGDPAAGPVPPLVASCEHCLTVTWAGVPACSCEFGRSAATEESALGMRLGAPGGAARWPDGSDSLPPSRDIS
ncbi:hypothetical protein [Streptosporangium sp. CA-115845]|uniref:hypothetical protein n=1 Tax=Streptosporangium sp. CA-115845 TaxID=3240071 RepID=UPI003D89F097